ncbi:uncharacterized protein [Triticum aestivum]|uniref:uncharacterized protein isoform X1 n=1 Tax=Triticum aestivum TaxID=4565 RepID=UPI001D00FA2B|nr:uncharacterized protein LOC123059153 isoform X1 [Triticum aestivum]
MQALQEESRQGAQLQKDDCVASAPRQPDPQETHPSPEGGRSDNSSRATRRRNSSEPAVSSSPSTRTQEASSPPWPPANRCASSDSYVDRRRGMHPSPWPLAATGALVALSASASSWMHALSMAAAARVRPSPWPSCNLPRWRRVRAGTSWCICYKVDASPEEASSSGEDCCIQCRLMSGAATVHVGAATGYWGSCKRGGHLCECVFFLPNQFFVFAGTMYFFCWNQDNFVLQRLQSSQMLMSFLFEAFLFCFNLPPDFDPWQRFLLLLSFFARHSDPWRAASIFVSTLFCFCWI